MTMLQQIPGHWRIPLAVLLALWLVTATVFTSDITAMLWLWWDSSTFNHILFVPFLIGWLVMQRAPLIAPLRPHPWWPGVAAMLVAGVVWLVGDAAGVALFRQMGVVLMLQAAVAAALGPRLVQALAFPIGYALVMVPFGDELVGTLQNVTADLCTLLLAAAQIPAFRQGVLITTPNGFFEVAEACSGVMFLVAMFAFSLLAANLCFRSWWRRILFVGGALVTTILANAMRAFGTIWIAENFGIEHAAGIDHIIYGWFFFAIVIVIVMVVARPWFDRPASDPAVNVDGLDRPASLTGQPVIIASFAAAALLAAPLWGGYVGGRSGVLPPLVSLPVVPGWTIGGTPDPMWKARFDGADHFVQRRYTDAQGRSVDVALSSFARQADGREVVGFGQGAIDPEGNWTWSERSGAISDAPLDRLFHIGPVLRDAASWYVVDDQLVTDPRMAKLWGLKARLLGGDPRAAALIISAETERGGASALNDWLKAAGGAREVADRALKTR